MGRLAVCVLCTVFLGDRIVTSQRYEGYAERRSVLNLLKTSDELLVSSTRSEINSLAEIWAFYFILT